MPAPVPSRHSEDDAPVSSLSRVQLLEVLTDLVRDLERLDLALSADGSRLLERFATVSLDRCAIR